MALSFSISPFPCPQMALVMEKWVEYKVDKAFLSRLSGFLYVGHWISAQKMALKQGKKRLALLLSFSLIDGAEGEE